LPGARIVYAQLQTRLAAEIAAGSVRLVSITFDPAHEERASSRAIERHGRDATAGILPDRSPRPDLQRLLRAFGVVVIEDGLGGYTHNAAVLVVDRDGRLAKIVDLDDPEDVVRSTRELLAKRSSHVAHVKRQRAGLGCLRALVALAFPAVRSWFEHTMVRHLLVQMPLLALIGACFAAAWMHAHRDTLAARALHGVQRFNAGGATHPRSKFHLDVVDVAALPRSGTSRPLAVDGLKFVTIPAAGLAVALSWGRLPAIARAVGISKSSLRSCASVGATSPRTRACVLPTLAKTSSSRELLLWIRRSVRRARGLAAAVRRQPAIAQPRPQPDRIAAAASTFGSRTPRRSTLAHAAVAATFDPRGRDE
jgi:hypothetical protein